MTVTISLDAMSGDHGPVTVVHAALKALRKDPNVNLILVGDGELIDKQLQTHDCKLADWQGRLKVVHTTQVVTMTDTPAVALRTKKDSSMRVAINMVKSGEADACVSAGNTGALMATAKFVLKTLPGIERPAIIVQLPTINGHTHVLDLGANVDASAEQLFQFAVMGVEVVKAVDNIDNPSVGLLNVGEEEIKGNEQVKEAARLIEQSDLNYLGYAEGDTIYKGGVDVIVCDGFVGNVALKSTEGVAKMIMHYLKEEFRANWFRRISAMLAIPALRALKKRVDPRNYNGASLVGLQRIVIKSHGSADAVAFTNAIHVAKLEVQKAVPENISQRLESALVG